MAYESAHVEPIPRKHLEATEDTDEMRSQGTIADRLPLELDCPSLGSSECPSMASSFSPLDSPTPTSMYSQTSLTSPSWHEGGSFSVHPNQHYDRHTGSTPMRSAFRLADMTATTGDSMAMPYALDTQDRMPMPEYLPGYDDNVEQFWIPSDMPKTYDNPHGMQYLSGMASYPTMARTHYRHAPYLPESATNPCLSRPIFSQPERMSSSMSMGNMLHWMPPTESMAPQTIAPSQAFPQTAPVTPPPSYSDFPTSLNAFKQTPTTSIRSCSLGTPSGTETPVSRVSGGAGDFHEDFPLSPYRDGMSRPSRLPSRKLSRKSSKNNLTLESLPPIIKQVQFKCKEPGCKGRFKRQEHLKRHMKSHSQEKPHVCWVPGCHRAFSRSDNLNAHYTKTHSKRGGRNRYVATLDETSPDYDPDFRGQLTPDGRPIYGSKLDDPMDTRELSVDAWDE